MGDELTIVLNIGKDILFVKKKKPFMIFFVIKNYIFNDSRLSKIIFLQ